MESTFDLSTKGNELVVTVTGEVDISNVSDLGNILLDAENSSDAFVVIDLTNTAFIDSSAVSAFSAFQKRLRAKQRSAALVCPEENIEVSRVLSLIGISAAIPVHGSLDDIDAG